MFKPLPFNVAMKILTPTDTMVKGVKKKVYSSPSAVSDDFLFFGSFRTFGGTENFSNDVYIAINTAVVDTWYNPKITTECEICVLETGEIYEVITPPEDIEMRHQFMQFKVQKVGGKT